MRDIGPGQPAFIVAEVGVNHMGSLDHGIRLIEGAKRAGCDAVKFQLYTAEKLAARRSPLYWEGKSTSQQEFFSSLDKLPLSDFQALIRYGESIGLIMFATPFDEEAVDFLDDLDTPMFKVASGDITHFALLSKIASTGRPVILSTGASHHIEIERAIKILQRVREDVGCRSITLLGCSLTYPCPNDCANLRQISALKSVFPSFPIGWSDHTQNTLTPALAVSLGACMIERHFGDRSIEGADNGWAADEAEMIEVIKNVRLAEQLLGIWPPRKYILHSEIPARNNARRSLAARVNIECGDYFSISNVTALRPGTGEWPADRIYEVVGHRARQTILAGELLTKADVL
jgi:N,N'-diacetyllegionaminate synthase